MILHFHCRSGAVNCASSLLITVDINEAPSFFSVQRGAASVRRDRFLRFAILARARDPSARPGRSGRRFTKLQRSGRARKKNGFAGEARSARGAVRARNHTGKGPVRTTMSAQVASGMGSRMAKEVRALATSPPEGIKYVETDADQLTEIHAEISGPSTRARAATKKYERGRGGRTARGRPARARPQRERRTRAALSASSSCSGRTSPRRRRGASS